MNYRKMVGSQVRKLRRARGWSQSVLAAKLQILGLDIDRTEVVKIESGRAHVIDYKLLYFATLFRVEVADLLSRGDAQK